MRLWTVHPRYLDSKGLVAAWREALLAQKVLSGATRGYRHHPQLLRFQSCKDPLAAIATFLHGIAAEAQRRGYAFDASKILQPRSARRIRETRGQLAYEWRHLRRKLRTRAPAVAASWRAVVLPDPHPLFILVEGEVREWEKPVVLSRRVPQPGAKRSEAKRPRAKQPAVRRPQPA
jgi:hypothetical protein